MKIYLDSNATGLLDPRVVETLKSSLDLTLGNPSSPHSFGQAAKGFISQARRIVANFLKVPQAQVIFTSGGSEGASLAIRGLLKDEENSPHIISSNIEHACVFETLEALKAKGAEITYLPAGLKGAIELNDLENAITPRTKMICLMAVNNETGVKTDLEGISKIAERHRIPLVVDGVAWLGKETIVIPSGVTAIFFSGHKIHAPQGVGFVILRTKKLTPQILGGSQEFGLRGGTENMLGILGLSKAISLLQEEQAVYIPQIAALRDHFENEVLKLPGVSVNGSGPRVCNTTNLAFEGMDGETFLIALDQKGVFASLGSACSSGSIEPSRILLSMGIPLSKARASLRFSFSRLNSMEEVNRAIEIIKEIKLGSPH